MSDSNHKSRQICGRCGRVSQKDLARHFCPVTAWIIHYNKPADRCRLFVDLEDDMCDNESHRRGE